MLEEAQFILGAFRKNYPEMAKYHSTDCKIFHQLPFENAIIKLLEGNESQLNATERTVVT